MGFNSGFKGLMLDTGGPIICDEGARCVENTRTVSSVALRDTGGS